MTMELNERLQRCGITQLNDMQREVGDVIRRTNDDVVVLSPTGSGKTLAYLLPVINQIDVRSDLLQAVVILPGRELAMQSADVLKRVCQGVRCYACYGGRMTMDEHRELRKVLPHIVFATPGRLDDHLNKGNLTCEGLRFVVIDEFDKCLQMGFSAEMQSILGKVPKGVRKILLSATDAEAIPDFVDMSRTTRVDFLSQDRDTTERVSYYRVDSQQKDKLPTLISLLRAVGEDSSMVFVNYRESVERVASALKDSGFVCGVYHGGLDQKARETSLHRFLNGSVNVLVCTDLASRGLDIPSVGNIIHYHLPENEDAYIHRVGRTARWDAVGKAFFLLSPTEQLPSYVNAEEVAPFAIPDTLPAAPQPRFATIYIGKGKQNKISRGDVVGFLCKKANLKSADIGRIDILERYCYVAIAADKVRQVLRMANGEKIKGVKTVVETVE